MIQVFFSIQSLEFPIAAKDTQQMNKILPIVLLFGGLIIFSNSIDNAFTKPVQPAQYMVASTPSMTSDSPKFQTARLNQTDLEVKQPSQDSKPI